MTISASLRKQTISDYRRHQSDTGSPQVQIAILTERINALAGHLQNHDKDNHSRRGLLQLVSKRNKLLRYLARTQQDEYRELIKRLGLPR